MLQKNSSVLYLQTGTKPARFVLQPRTPAHPTLHCATDAVVYATDVGAAIDAAYTTAATDMLRRALPYLARQKVAYRPN